MAKEGAAKNSASGHQGQRFFRAHGERVTEITVAWAPAVRAEWRGVLTASAQARAKEKKTGDHAHKVRAHTHDKREEARVPGEQGHGDNHNRSHTHSHNHKAHAPPLQAERWASVCVWDSATLEVKCWLGAHREDFASDICSLSFNQDGLRLAVLTSDRRHTLSIWDWQQGVLVAQAATHQYPATTVMYSPYCRPLQNGGKELLVTFGRRHVRFWTLQGLEGKAREDGLPSVDPARVKGGLPHLEVWDMKSSRLPLQPVPAGAAGRGGRGHGDGQGGGSASAHSGEGGEGGEGRKGAGGSRLRPQGVGMDEAGSDEYLQERWRQKAKGFLAGAGETATIPAVETSNRNQGKVYAAHVPEDVNEKAYRITDPRIVADPGPTNSGWEEGCMLNVVRGRPEFDSRGVTKQALTRLERELVSRPSAATLHGRTGIFELERRQSKGDYTDLPVDGRQLLQLVQAGKLPEAVALSLLEQRGWRKNVLTRYMSPGNAAEAGGGRGGKSVLAGAGTGAGGGAGAGAHGKGNLVGLGGSLQQSRVERRRLAVPHFVSAGGWYVIRAEQDVARQSAFQDVEYVDDQHTKHYFMAAGTDGKIYKWVVDLAPEGAPNVSLAKVADCHEGPVFAMQVFGDGSFFSGGADGYLRLWTQELELAWKLQRDNMRSEWQLNSGLVNLHVFNHQVLPPKLNPKHQTPNPAP